MDNFHISPFCSDGPPLSLFSAPFIGVPTASHQLQRRLHWAPDRPKWPPWRTKWTSRGPQWTSWGPKWTSRSTKWTSARGSQLSRGWKLPPPAKLLLIQPTTKSSPNLVNTECDKSSLRCQVSRPNVSYCHHCIIAILPLLAPSLNVTEVKRCIPVMNMLQ